MFSHPQISSVYGNGPAKQKAGGAQKPKPKAKKREPKPEWATQFVAQNSGPARQWSAANPTGTDKSVRANFFRAHPTESEAILSRALQTLKPAIRFETSVLLFGYIADFYCESHRLVVELDGSFHRSRKAQDSARDQHLAKRGIRTLRFPSSQAFNNLDGILKAIRNSCAESLVTARDTGVLGDTRSGERRDVNTRNSSAGFASGE